MALFSSIVQWTERSLFRDQETTSRRNHKFMGAGGCAIVAFSFVFSLATGEFSALLPNLLLGLALILDGISILWHTNRPTLAVVLRLASILVLVLFVAVGIARFLG